MIMAFDPGNGNSKICINGEVVVVQSAISRPRALGRAGVGMRASTKVTEVFFEDKHYVVGPGAWELGELRGVLDYYSLASAERLAFLYAGIAELLQPEHYEVDMLVVGLPVPLLQDEFQADSVMTRLKNFKGEHVFQVNDMEYSMYVNRLKVLPQPVGAYADYILDDELNIRPGASKQTIAPIDIGTGTVDIYAINNGRPEPRSIGGGKQGVRRLLEMLNENGHELQELDNELRSRRLRPSKQQLETWLDEILNGVEDTWKNLRRFDVVIPVGGGAAILGDLLHLALISKGAHVYWPEDPITTNVRGLWKWAAHGLRD